jgi:2-enoate reductase
MSKNYDEILNRLEDSYGDWFNGKFEIPKMTKNLYPYDKMFSPININRVKVKNRIVMAPMGNICMADETGRPSKDMIAYFEERAKGGVGLITTGLIPVSMDIDNSLTEKGDLSIFPRIDRSRTVFAGWRDLSAACHAHGLLFLFN